MNLFNELKRRNVFRVGIAYLVTAWLLLQLLSILLPTFNAPEWVMQVFVVMLAVGFVVALFVAWAFELTPEGIKPTHAVSPEESIAPATGKKLNRLVIITLVLVLVLVIADAYVLNDRETATPVVAVTDTSSANPEDIIDTTDLASIPVKSIAVLPFVDLSENKDQEYFTDGLSEELLNRLARVQDLQVAGRTSSFYFKGRNESMAEIGSELGVAHILEGSVRKADNQVRVSAQLIRADNGFQLWADTYDRNLEDIFSIQDEIAEAVTIALSVSLSAGEFNRPGMTTNVQAYEAYLRANKEDTPDPVIALQTISDLENAVAIDPDFGLAWNALYRAYVFTTLSMPPAQSAEYIPLAANALERIRELMPDSSDFLTTNAYSQRRMGNWVEAEEMFLMAISQFGNSNAKANLDYGELLWSVGRLRDAVPYLERARRLDPKQVDIATRLSVTLLALEQFDDAREEALRGLSINPENGFIRSAFGMTLFREGKYQEILDTMMPPPGSPVEVWQGSMEKFIVGDHAGAIEAIKAFSEGQQLSGVAATTIAPGAALNGDHELALSILSGSANTNINDLFGSLPIWQPELSDMRQLEGFKDLLAMSGITDYWRTTGNWGDYCRLLPDSDTDFECF